MDNAANRLNFVDSLRGFAALYVILFHMVLVPSHRLQIPEYIKGFIMNGGSGVTLFFVISAFTLCYTLDGRNDKKGYIFQFYIRRFFRIVPLYWSWLFLVLILEGWPGYKPFFIYSTFTFNFFPYHQEGIVWASWTLGIEVIFYFFFPFIFKYVNDVKKSFVFLVISIVFMIIHYNLTKNIDGYKAYIGILNQLPVFSVGILLYFVFKKIEPRTKNKKLGYCLIVSSLCLFLFSKELFGWLGYASSFLVKAFLYSIFFLGLFICPFQLFVNKITFFFGKISYSLYLNHPRIIFAMTTIYFQIDKIVNQQETSLLISFFTTLIVLVPISYLTYTFIEKPCINYAKHLSSSKQ